MTWRTLLLVVVALGFALFWKANSDLSVSRVGIDDKPYYEGVNVAASSVMVKRQEVGR
jgi:hypothetical protein